VIVVITPLVGVGIIRKIDRQQQQMGKIETTIVTIYATKPDFQKLAKYFKIFSIRAGL